MNKKITSALTGLTLIAMTGCSESKYTPWTEKDVQSNIYGVEVPMLSYSPRQNSDTSFLYDINNDGQVDFIGKLGFKQIQFISKGAEELVKTNVGLPKDYKHYKLMSPEMQESANAILKHQKEFLRATLISEGAYSTNNIIKE